MPIHPTKRRVLVHPQQEKLMDGEIHLLHAPDDKEAWGTVRAVGPDVADLKENDRVLYSRYAGIDIDENDTRFLLMSEHDIIAVEG